MALPDASLLLIDREEARDLADKLAGALDAVLNVVNGQSDLTAPHGYAEITLQEWQERSWSHTRSDHL